METGYNCLKKKPRTRKRTHRERTARGRQLGSNGTASLARTELERQAMLKGATVAPDGRLAVEVMDERIAHFEGLMTTLYPWDESGKKMRGKSVQAYYWASEMQRDYVQMRAPYQSPRLSAVQIVPAQNRQQTTEINVTILNEKGDVEYTDAPADDDAKLIEHLPADEEAA